MAKIECMSLSGSMMLIDEEEVSVRPAAYGIIIRDNRILLMTMRANGKYHLPGGSIEKGETTSAEILEWFGAPTTVSAVQLIGAQRQSSHPKRNPVGMAARIHSRKNIPKGHSPWNQPGKRCPAMSRYCD